MAGTIGLCRSRAIGVSGPRSRPPGAAGGTVLALGDITDQRQHLALLVNGDRAELPGRTVEPTDGGMPEAADRGDLRGLQALGARELFQLGDGLIARYVAAET